MLDGWKSSTIDPSEIWFKLLMKMKTILRDLEGQFYFLSVSLSLSLSRHLDKIQSKVLMIIPKF